MRSVILCLALLVGCASFLAVAAPLPPAANRAPPGSGTISADGHRLDALKAPDALPGLLVLVATSGSES